MNVIDQRRPIRKQAGDKMTGTPSQSGAIQLIRLRARREGVSRQKPSDQLSDEIGRIE